MSAAPLPDHDPAERGSPRQGGLPAGLPVPVEVERVEAAEEAEAPGGPTLKLLSFAPRRDDQVGASSTSTRPPRDWRKLAAAAGVASFVAIGAAAAGMQYKELRVARAERAETHLLAKRLDAMSARFESLDANRTRDELANVRKVLTEMKAGVASTRDVSGAVAQLGARVDRLEKDQGGRMDKLADRIDRDGAGRIADIATRLDKLEAKTNAVGAHDVSGAVAQLSAHVDHLEKDQSARLDKLADRIDHEATGHVAELGARLDKLETKVGVAAAAAPKPASVVKTEAAKFEPSVSNETTGSIERARPRLRGYRLAEVHNGYAMIDSPGGEFAVAPGDMVPGVGRVLRIERRGRDWVVVTTLGQIVAMDD